MYNHRQYNKFVHLLFGFILTGFTLIAVAANDMGRVIDANTNLPISKANIVVWWTGYDTNNQQNTLECIAIRSLKIDKNGEFILPAEPSRISSGDYSEVERHFFAFKAGYMDSPLSYRKNAIEKKRYFMQKDERPLNDRVRYLSDMMARVECQQQKNRKVYLLPYYKSLYKEANQMRLPERDQVVLGQIRRRLVSSWKDGKQTNSRNDMEKYFDDNIKGVLLKH